MATTIGQQLRHAREAKSLSVEDAAHDTRIHANSIRSLEADDYSGFASITYAKSFLQLYSRYLGVDATETIAVFQGGGGLNLKGSRVLTDVTDTVEPMQGVPGKTYRQKKRKPARAGNPGAGGGLFLGVIVGVLLIAIPAFYFLGWKAESPEEIPGTIAENLEKAPENIAKSFEEIRKEARERAARERETAISKGEPDPALKREAEKILAASSKTATETNTRETKPKPATPEPEPTAPEQTIAATPPTAPVRATPIPAVPISTPENENSEPTPDPNDLNAAAEAGEENRVWNEIPRSNGVSANVPGPESTPEEDPEKPEAPTIAAAEERKPKPQQKPAPSSSAVTTGVQSTPTTVQPEPDPEPEPEPEPERKKREVTPIRATPIIARPIMVNEDPEARPIEDITPNREKSEAEASGTSEENDDE